MSRSYPIPENFDPEADDAGSVHRWLVAQGCTVDSVSILNENGTLIVSVETDDDPVPALASFPRTKSQNEQITEALDSLDMNNVSELATAVNLLRAALGV